MAELTSNGLSLSIEFAKHPSNRLLYRFSFLWKGKQILNEDVLGRDMSGKIKSKVGSVITINEEEETLIPFFEVALEFGIAEYWESSEPGITIAVYPELYFPFLPTNSDIIYASDSFKAIREAYKKLKVTKQKIDDDDFTIIVLFDTGNFRGGRSSDGEGISMHLVVERVQLERFVTNLRREYSLFIQKLLPHH